MIICFISIWIDNRYTNIQSKSFERDDVLTGSNVGSKFAQLADLTNSKHHPSLMNSTLPTLKKNKFNKEIAYQGIIDVFDQEEANQFVKDFHRILSQILAI